MGLTELTLRLLLLFFPGIICFLIVEALTVHKDRKTHEVLFFTYLYGMLSYVVYGFILMIIGLRIYKDWSQPFRHGWTFMSPSSGPMFFKSLTNSKVDLDFSEIGSVAIVAFLLALALTYCDTKKLLHKLFGSEGSRFPKLTNKFGEPNVWSRTLNNDKLRWCVVRDLAHKLMFQGYIVAFSDVDDVAELFLTQVVVYTEGTSEFCYRADHMYLARKRDDLTVEFQHDPMEGQVANGQSTQDNGGTIEASSPSGTHGRNDEKGGAEPAAYNQSNPTTATGGQLTGNKQRKRRKWRKG